MKPEFSKPFDLAAARAGAPFACFDGCTAEILKYTATELFGTITNEEGSEFAASWRPDGNKSSGVLGEQKALIMLPLGFIDGKPVFYRDEYVHIDGEIVTALPMDMSSGFAGAKWPAPAKVYPETRMNFEQLCAAGSMSRVSANSIGVRHLANGALRHAIDTGQVIAKEEHEAALALLGERLMGISLGDRTARDLGIAREIIAACKARFDGDPACSYSGDYVIQRLSGVHIKAAIASVNRG